MTWPAAADSDWLDGLRAAGHAGKAARSRLRDELQRVARVELDRRGSAGISGADRDDMTAPDAAAASSAVAAITNDLDSYRGDAPFAAWAAKFVIAALTEEAGRRYWQDTIWSDRSPDWNQLRTALGFAPDGPDAPLTTATLRSAVEEDLTASQRLVFTAVALGNLPAEALTSGLGPGRNAIYQALFQARRIVGARLAGAGGAGRPGEALAADPGDAGCDVAFQMLDRYAVAAADASDGERFRGVTAHLGACRPCQLDYQGLVAAVPAP